VIRRLLNIQEAATYLGLAPRTLYNGIAPKSRNPFPIKPVRIGKLRKFDIRDLDRFIEESKNDGEED
jgi:predicted DNA-binding transcriptional regulator AlpA